MNAMRRTAPAPLRTLLLAGLGVLAFALSLPGDAPSAHAEDVVAPVDPAEVGRLLLDPDPAARARGQALLLRRVEAAGSDLPAFLEAMGRAQVAYANSESRLVEHWIERAIHGATEEERRQARRLLVAMGTPATRRLLEAFRREAEPAAGAPDAPAGAVESETPPAPSSPAEPAPAPETEPAPPAGEEKGPRVPIRLWVTEVPLDEARGLLESLPGGGPARTGGPAAAAEWSARVLRLPDAARPREAERRIPLDAGRTDVLPPLQRRYREGLERTRDGAWRVVNGEVPSGLSVAVSAATTKAGLVLELRAAYAKAAEPMPVVRRQPEPGVEPIELDVPEWEVTAATTTAPPLPPGGHAVLALIPGVLPDPERAVLVIAVLAAP